MQVREIPPESVQIMEHTTPACEYVVHADAAVTIVFLSTDNNQSEYTLHVRLVGARARAQIVGLVAAGLQAKIILHTLQQHEAPDTSSDLLVKSVLTDEAVFSYDGAIRVEKTAQKTDAYQRNENLLLSEQARAQSKPALEILANDVRCTHGATVMNLDADQLWYLAARGIAKNTARSMIAHGFLDSALAWVSDTIMQERIRGQLWTNS